MPLELGNTPKLQKMKVVSVQPYCSSDPNSPKFEQYCKQKLIPLWSIDQLKGACHTQLQKRTPFFSVSQCSPFKDIARLNSQQVKQEDEDANEVYNYFI